MWKMVGEWQYGWQDLIVGSPLDLNKWQLPIFKKNIVCWSHTVTNLLPNLYNLFKYLYGWFKSFLKSKQLPSEPLYYDIHNWQRQLDQIANLNPTWFNKEVHGLDWLSKRLILVFLHLCYRLPLLTHSHAGYLRCCTEQFKSFIFISMLWNFPKFHSVFCTELRYIIFGNDNDWTPCVQHCSDSA